MDSYELINERVAVACTFRLSDPRSLCYPAKMRWRGRDISFTKLGLRHPTTKGSRMLHVFDMSDGDTDYRLEFDAESLTWTLVTISAGVDHAAA